MSNSTKDKVIKPTYEPPPHVIEASRKIKSDADKQAKRLFKLVTS